MAYMICAGDSSYIDFSIILRKYKRFLTKKILDRVCQLHTQYIMDSNCSDYPNSYLRKFTGSRHIREITGEYSWRNSTGFEAIWEPEQDKWLHFYSRKEFITLLESLSSDEQEARILLEELRSSNDFTLLDH